jgi:hypothetical protein
MPKITRAGGASVAGAPPAVPAEVEEKGAPTSPVVAEPTISAPVVRKSAPVATKKPTKPPVKERDSALKDFTGDILDQQ